MAAAPAPRDFGGRHDPPAIPRGTFAQAYLCASNDTFIARTTNWTDHRYVDYWPCEPRELLCPAQHRIHPLVSPGSRRAGEARGNLGGLPLILVPKVPVGNIENYRVP